MTFWLRIDNYYCSLDTKNGDVTRNKFQIAIVVNQRKTNISLTQTKAKLIKLRPCGGFDF